MTRSPSLIDKDEGQGPFSQEAKRPTERTDGVGGQRLAWSGLDAFTQGYVEALFAEATRDHPGAMSGGGFAFPMTVDFSDLAPETLARIIADCEAWRAEYTGRVAEMSSHRSDMGRAFWTIRQEGKRSTFPPLTVLLGDDGKVRLA